jgi:hypothetical protein
VVRAWTDARAHLGRQTLGLEGGDDAGNDGVELVLVQEGQHRALHRGEVGRKRKDGPLNVALLGLVLLLGRSGTLLAGVEVLLQDGVEDATNTKGWLNHVGEEVLARHLLLDLADEKEKWQDHN